MYPSQGNDEERLDSLFRAYRAACPDRDPSPNFMPHLWQQIDARQTFTFSLRRMASGFVTAAVALTIALVAYMSLPHSRASANSPLSYLEALADANSLDTPEIVGPVHLEISDPGR